MNKEQATELFFSVIEAMVKLSDVSTDEIESAYENLGHLEIQFWTQENVFETDNDESVLIHEAEQAYITEALGNQFMIFDGQDDFHVDEAGDLFSDYERLGNGVVVCMLSGYFDTDQLQAMIDDEKFYGLIEDIVDYANSDWLAVCDGMATKNIYQYDDIGEVGFFDVSNYDTVYLYDEDEADKHGLEADKERVLDCGDIPDNFIAYIDWEALYNDFRHGGYGEIFGDNNGDCGESNGYIIIRH